MPWCNSMGLGLMGGKCVESALEALQAEGPTTVIILENDIYRYLDVAAADQLLHAANHVVVHRRLREPDDRPGGLRAPGRDVCRIHGDVREQ